MKRSSFTQFTIMVEFMERFGVLSKPVGGPHGRHTIVYFIQFCLKFQVWSDFKNATKKKAAKLRNSMRGTGGGPALKICNDDLVEQIQPIQQEPKDDNIIVLGDEDWNMPGTSEVPIIISTQDLAPPMPSPPATTPEPHWTPPPPKKKTKTSTAANTFIQCERERDEKYIALERERIRQRDTVLQLQAQWLEICKEILKMIKEYLSKDSSA
ncbi:hypothetical protein ABMA27_008169 [Loxostege sticticalis]|uniref:Uncharacterized protein n=1 Tax=Loxostege sticticalis TaxID=481309 RepID=A0ABR3HEA8_LOXSC